MRELLQQALSVIKKSRSGYGDNYHTEEERTVITALEAELAKQLYLDTKADNARELGLSYEVKQEPVAWMYRTKKTHTLFSQTLPPNDAYDEGTLVPLYAALPRKEWVGLTITEREQIQQECFGKVPHHVAFSYAIQAKLKEKNE
jgi:hypothetical protein